MIAGNKRSGFTISEFEQPPRKGPKLDRDGDHGESGRVRHDSIDARKMHLGDSVPTAFNTIGISGSAVVNNIGGHYINYIVDLDSSKKIDTKELREWLAAPDPSRNYHAARETHHAETGSWFICGEVFTKWKELPGHPLWVNGSPGCGKTIICSSAIEGLSIECKEQPSAACAYFFFDSRNAESEQLLLEKLLRSFILQLWHQLDRTPTALADLYGEGPSHPQPSISALQDVLQAIVGEYQHVYIIIDALDECADGDRLLSWIKNILHRRAEKLHILLSSRPERDIEDQLLLIDGLQRLDFAGGSANPDILKFINERLLDFPKWDFETRAIVINALLEGADGSFRWVALQLTELSRCTNIRSLKQQLGALPKDLEETYQRLLCRSSQPNDLRSFLQWVAFSARPIRLEELAEVITIDYQADGRPCYDADLRYMDPRDVLTICSGFVTQFEGFIKLAHMSVKDFLISEKISSSAAAYFSINAMQSQSSIAQTCLAYLSHFGVLDSLSYASLASFPLAAYAANHWTSHFRGCSGFPLTRCLEALISRLFLSTPNSYANWMWLLWQSQIHGGTKSWQREEIDQLSAKMSTPLYMAALLGLYEVVRQLLVRGSSVDTGKDWYCNALYVAACEGHLAIVELLIDLAPRFNLSTIDGYNGTPLVVAASRGRSAFFDFIPTDHEELRSCHGAIVPRPLADVHSIGVASRASWQGKFSENEENSRREQEALVRWLFQRGTDLNAQDRSGKNALHWATNGGKESMVQLLLQCGVDVDVQSPSGTPLYQASACGKEAIVRLLLQHGADSNICVGIFGTPLYRSSGSGYEAIVRLLLQHGADINVQGALGTALHEASRRGHQTVVQLLLENSADVNAQGKHGETALLHASCHGYETVVLLLVKHGAHVDAPRGAPLPGASQRGYEAIVRLLLEHGADVNAREAKGTTALQEASRQGHEIIVRLLLERGAKVNIHGGKFGAALCQASRNGHETIARLLIAHGADVNNQGGRVILTGTQLPDAPQQDPLAILPLPLEQRADLKITGKYETALHRASQGGHEIIARLLLEHGADVNARGISSGTALHQASQRGHEAIVRLLLKYGADVHARRVARGTALHEAIRIGHEDIVRLLLENGADVHSKVDPGSNSQSSGWQYALDLAIERDYGAIENLLRSYGAERSR